MPTSTLLRGAVLGLGLVLLAIEVLLPSRRAARAAEAGLAALSVLNAAFLVFLCLDHMRFPLFLELMEGTIFQHFQRAAAFQPIYTSPAPGFVPLAYNPLYYVVAVPFSWIFGASLGTLRLVASLAAVGSGAVLFWVARRKTGSAWWGLVAAGLFAAAYRVMDASLDNAHSDSCFLLAALLGSLVIDRSRSRAGELSGVALLAASFWFKQHGALFLIGGLAFLTARNGPRRSLPHWLLGAILGPGAYLLAGPTLFGPFFHYFTWQVPRNWTEVNVETFRRYGKFIYRSYPVLAWAGCCLVLWNALWQRKRVDIWQVQLVFATLSGLMGAFDPGSSDNVFIAMGTWFVLVGVLGLETAAGLSAAIRRYRLHLVALFTAFAALTYDPREVMVSPRARESYQDLIGLLRGLDGPVYAPWLGQLPTDYQLRPAVHWVALDDLLRGPGRDTRDQPLTRRLVAPALDPGGPAYLLTHQPLEDRPEIAFLSERYVLQQDMGERFKALRLLPKRWDHGWPRYLYRFKQGGAAPRPPEPPARSRE
jgi:hypothetical protein